MRMVKAMCLVAVLVGFAKSGFGDDKQFVDACREQLKQIYQATMEFVKENDGYLPPAFIHEDLKTPLKASSTWYIMLIPYLEKAGLKAKGKYVKDKRLPDDTVFYCAANPHWFGGFGPFCGNYLWNRNLGAYGKNTKPDEIKLIKLDEVENKQRTILLTDAASYAVSDNRTICHYMGSDKNHIGFWHDGKANVLFMDGSIELLSRDEIKNEWFIIKSVDKP